MAGYAKLFSTILASSVWDEPDHVRIVWITLMAMADSDGYVKSSIKGVAHMARKTVEQTEDAMRIFEAPDKHSSRKAFEGRRIKAVDGGWMLLNYDYYRELGMSESARDYWREKKRKQRGSENVQDSPRHSKTPVDVYVDGADAVSPEEGDGEKPTVRPKPPWTLKEWAAAIKSLQCLQKDADACWAFYDSQGWCKIKQSGVRVQITGDPRSLLTSWLDSPQRLQPNGGQSSIPAQPQRAARPLLQ